MTEDALQRLAGDWPDWVICRSRNERYWIATYRWRIPISLLLSTEVRPDPTVIADSAPELADLLSRQPRNRDV